MNEVGNVMDNSDDDDNRSKSSNENVTVDSYEVVGAIRIGGRQESVDDNLVGSALPSDRNQAGDNNNQHQNDEETPQIDGTPLPPSSPEIISAELVDEEANKEIMRQFVAQEIQSHLRASSENPSSSIAPITVVATNATDEVSSSLESNNRSDSNNNNRCLIRFLLAVVMTLIAVVVIVVVGFMGDNNGGDSSPSSPVSGESHTNDTIGVVYNSTGPSDVTSTDNGVAPSDKKVLKYGDVAYFELLYDNAKLDLDGVSSNNITSLWLSGGRGRDNEFVMTRDLLGDEYENTIANGHFQWIIRSSKTSNGKQDEIDPQHGTCVKYGSVGDNLGLEVWLQVNKPNHRWLSGGRGRDNIYVSTRDVVFDEDEIENEFHYPWVIRSNNDVDVDGNDPKLGDCIQYQDVVLLQVSWMKTRWLTGGRDEIPPEPNIYFQPMEQVYSKDINDVNESNHQDLFHWKLHDCAFDCS